HKTWASRKSLQPLNSHRNSSTAISNSPAAIISRTSSKSSARSRAARGWTNTQPLPLGWRRKLTLFFGPVFRSRCGPREGFLGLRLAIASHHNRGPVRPSLTSIGNESQALGPVGELDG